MYKNNELKNIKVYLPINTSRLEENETINRMLLDLMIQIKYNCFNCELVHGVTVIHRDLNMKKGVTIKPSLISNKRLSSRKYNKLIETLYSIVEKYVYKLHLDIAIIENSKDKYEVIENLHYKYTSRDDRVITPSGIDKNCTYHTELEGYKYHTTAYNNTTVSG